MTRRNSLVVMLVSSDLARTAGINVRRLNLLYLLMFALTLPSTNRTETNPKSTADDTAYSTE